MASSRVPFSRPTVVALESMFRRQIATAAATALARQHAVLAGIVSGGRIVAGGPSGSSANDLLTDADGNVLVDADGNTLTQQ